MTSEVEGEPKTEGALKTRLKNVSRSGHHQLFQVVLGGQVRFRQRHECWILKQGDCW